MVDHGDVPAAAWWRTSIVLAVLTGVVVGLVGDRLFVPVPGGSGVAIGTVGLVLAEAVVLYVGYGAVTRAVTPTARGILGIE